MLSIRLKDVRPETGTIRKVAAFPVLLAVALCVVLSEFLLIFLLPYLPSAIRIRLSAPKLC